LKVKKYKEKKYSEDITVFWRWLSKDCYEVEIHDFGNLFYKREYLSKDELEQVNENPKHFLDYSQVN